MMRFLRSHNPFRKFWRSNATLEVGLPTSSVRSLESDMTSLGLLPPASRELKQLAYDYTGLLIQLRDAGITGARNFSSILEKVNKFHTDHPEAVTYAFDVQRHLRRNKNDELFQFVRDLVSTRKEAKQ